MKVHLGNEQTAFLGDFGSSSNEVSKLLVNSTVVVHSEGNKYIFLPSIDELKEILLSLVQSQQLLNKL